MKRIISVLLALFVSLIVSGAVWPQAIMQPDEATLIKWMDDYENGPRAFLDDVIQGRLVQSQSVGLDTSINLLGHISYVPGERDQGVCGDSWVWAGTGALEIALDVQAGVKDRLSTQFLQSCKTDAYACCGGNLTDFEAWYAGKGFAIPWSNGNASFQDGSRGCEDDSSLVSCESISTHPRYPISNIQAAPILTTGVGQLMAIANIKNVLHQNKGVLYTFFLANQSDWNAFKNIWHNYGESTVWEPDFYCGHTWITSEGGGHAALIVGYDDEAPNYGDHYWIVLNSWGTANGNRPNGLFRLPMYMNYDCTYYLPSAGRNYSSHQFVTLNATVPKRPNLTPYQPTGWSDKIVVTRGSGTNADNSPLYPTDTLYVDWAVINNGYAATSSIFYTQLYVDGVANNSWFSNPPIHPNSYVSIQDYSIGSLGVGTHTIRIVANSNGAIDESDEGDNEYTKTINIQERVPQKPNLTPYQPAGWSDKIVVSKGTGSNVDTSLLYSTDTLYIDWAIVNNGTAAISTSFSTQLYVDNKLKHIWNHTILSINTSQFIGDYSIGPLSVGTHTIKIVTDSAGTITESNEGDNEYAKTITILDPPETVSVPSTPSGPLSGYTGATYTYSTGGSTSTLNHQIHYRFDWGDGTLSDWSSSTTASKSWSTANTYNVKAQAQCASHNSVQSVWTSGFSVNIADPPVQKPNLTPYQPSGWSGKIVISPQKGTSLDGASFYSTDILYLDWAVTNNGSAAISSPFETHLYIDGVFTQTWQHPKLPFDTGAYHSILDYSIGLLSAGMHTVRIVTDANGIIDESNENDNEYTKAIMVLPAGSDLTGSWTVPMAQTCRTWVTGTRCSIKGTFTLANIGNRNSISTLVHFYLSADGTFDGGDPLLKSVSTGNIRAARTKAVRLSINLPVNESASGKYVIAVIDPANTLPEIDESNNILACDPIP